MSTLAAIVAHTCNTVLEVLAMAIRAEKETKGIQIEKEVKLSLFANDMILSIENSKDATRKLLELINGSGKPAGHRSNAQKDPAFLNTNNKRSEREVEEIIPSITATKEQEMATHSSVLAWRIPWTEEPGRLQSTGSQRVGHD